MQLLEGVLKRSLENFLRGFGARDPNLNTTPHIKPHPEKTKRINPIGYWRGVPFEIVVREPDSAAEREVHVGVWRGVRCVFTTAKRATVLGDTGFTEIRPTENI